MDIITITYLVFMFVALYFFSFFIFLTLKNRKRLFSYPEPNTNYFISVIIPAYNEEASIKDTITHVANSDYPRDKFEIIVLNDGSNDKTGEIARSLVKRYSNLIVIDKRNSGKADSINFGIKRAKGELIAVVDSDSFPERDSLKKLTGYFDDKKMGAVTSFVTVRNKSSGLLAQIQGIEYLIMGWSRKLLDFVDSVYVTNGPLSLYRKSYILRVGGFDKKSITEDIDITWNMIYHGYKTGMCLDAKVSTVAPVKIKPWFRQRTRWGMGGLQALQKYGSMFFKKGMFGMFILPYVTFSIITSLFVFMFSAYLLLHAFLIRFITTIYVYESNSTLFRFSDINLYPSIILFYFIILFICSISYSIFVLYTTSYERSWNFRRVFNLLFYIFIYLTLYPIVWFVSIYRFVVRDSRWR